MQRRLDSPEAFHQGVDCQVLNEWCWYPEPHEHGGFACDKTCPCRSPETAKLLGVDPKPYGWQRSAPAQ
jgi:hypothetical protein